MIWEMLFRIGKRLVQAGVILGLGGLLTLLMLQPANAAKMPGSATSEAAPINVLEYTESPATRQEAYEQAAEVAQSPEQVLEAEEKEIEAYQQSQTNSGFVEGAQELLKRVTGQEN